MARTTLAAALAGAGAVLVGQAASPFHVATHEFTQLFSLLAFLAISWSSRGWGRSKSGAPAGEALVLALAAVAMLGVGAVFAQLAFNAFAHHCRMVGAVAFFWITWVPAGTFGAVVGVVWGELGWSRRRATAALAAMLLACAVYDVMQALAGVKVCDPLLGELSALNQRASMEVSAIQVYQRAWLFGLAGVIWAIRGAFRAPEARGARRIGALVTLAFFGATLTGGSHLGLGWGQGRLRSMLDATLRTPHFTVRYASGGLAAVRVRAIARECEWQWHSLSRDWGDEPASIELRVFEDDRDLSAATSHTDAHAVPRCINSTWQSASPDTLAHELVHVFQLEGSWWRPSRWLRRGFVEGSAEAWQGDLVRSREAHRAMASALQSGMLPALSQVMSLFGFWTVNETAAYEAAGSFVGWLVLEHGIERFQALDRRFDFERAYGRDLAALEADWHQFLAGIEVDPDERERARLRFDPELAPAYVADECPKLGPLTVPREEVAQRSLWLGDNEGALALYRELFDEEGEVLWAVRAAKCLQQLDRPAEALALVRKAAQNASSDEADQLSSRQVLSLMALRDWNGLYGAFEERERAAGSSPERRATEDCLRDLEVRERVADALDPANAARKVGLLEALAEEHPERLCVLYLAASARGMGWFGRLDKATRELTEAQLRHIEKDPGACALLSDSLDLVVQAAIREGDLDLAERIARSLARSCTDPLVRFHTARWLERVAWERE